MRRRMNLMMLVVGLSAFVFTGPPAQATSGFLRVHAWDFSFDITLAGASVDAKAGAGQGRLLQLYNPDPDGEPTNAGLTLTCLAVAESSGLTTVRAVGVGDDNAIYRIELQGRPSTGEGSLGFDTAPPTSATSCSGWSVEMSPAITFVFEWIAHA